MPKELKLWSLALLLACGPLAFAHAAESPAAPDAYLGLLAGRWAFTGTLRGQPVHYHVEGRWVLAHGSRRPIPAR